MLSYVLPHTLAALGLVVVFYLPGLVAERQIARRGQPSPFPHLTRFTLGLAFWCAFLFTIAALDTLRPAVVWAAIALVILAAAAFIFRQDQRPLFGTGRGTALVSESDARIAGDGARFSAAIPWAAVTLVIGAMFVLALRPTLAWDADTYHLTVPRLYIEHGGFRRIPFNVYSDWPMDVELLYGLGMMVYDYVVATLIHPVFTVLTVLAIAAICRVHGARWAGAVAACAFLANDVVLFESGVAYVDIALAFFFVMAVGYVLEAERAPAVRRRSLILAGICCGLMAGAKLSGLFGVAAIVADLAWDAIRARRLAAGAREIVYYIGIPTLLLAGPWYFKNEWYTGNPFYPLAYNLFGGVEWNAQLARQYHQFMHRIGSSRSVGDYLLLPVRVILESGPRYEDFGGRIGTFWIVLFPLAVVTSVTNSTVRRCMLAAGVYFICWAASSQQARFLIPILPLLAVASALSLARLPGLRTNAVPVRALHWALGIGAAAYLIASAAPYLADSRAWLERYRLGPGAMTELGVEPVYDYINHELPKDARIMLVNTNRGFFCRREYIADSFFEASQLNALLLRPARTKEDLARVLNAQGITHVMVAHQHPNIPYSPVLGDFLADPSMATLVYRSPLADRLYAINTTSVRRSRS